MWWMNKKMNKDIFSHISNKGITYTITFNYYGPDLRKVIGLTLEQVKEYLTEDEYLDLQRKIFEVLV